MSFVFHKREFCIQSVRVMETFEIWRVISWSLLGFSGQDLIQTFIGTQELIPPWTGLHRRILFFVLDPLLFYIFYFFCMRFDFIQFLFWVWYEIKASLFFGMRFIFFLCPVDYTRQSIFFFFSWFMYHILIYVVSFFHLF